MKESEFPHHIRTKQLLEGSHQLPQSLQILFLALIPNALLLSTVPLLGCAVRDLSNRPPPLYTDPCQTSPIPLTTQGAPLGSDITP